MKAFILGISQTDEPKYMKWIKFVSEALGCLNEDGARWYQLPSSGGYYDQDEFLMTVWEQIRYTYRDLWRNDADIAKKRSQ